MQSANQRTILLEALIILLILIEVFVMKRYDLRENREHKMGFSLEVHDIISGPQQREVLPTHWHNEHEIIYISQGSATFRIGDTAWRLKTGEMLFINPGEIHGAHSAGTEGCDWNAIVFEMSLLASGTGDDCDAQYIIPLCRNQLKFESYLPANTLSTSEVKQSIVQIIDNWHVQPDAFKLKIKGLLFDIIFNMAQNGSIMVNTIDEIKFHNDNLIQRVMTHVEDNITCPISLDELASIARMSRYHFCRWFKGYTGMRPMEYVNSARIHKAASLLRTGEKISQSAYRVGFNDLTYFSRVFRVWMQMSPTVYKRQYSSN